MSERHSVPSTAPPKLTAAEQIELKEIISGKLIKTYETHGLQQMTKTARDIIQRCAFANKPQDYRNTLKGECTEVVLQANLIEIQRIVRPSLSFKGLCFTKAGTNKTTELDVTFFTPFQIFLFECKCYAGPKILKGPGGVFSGRFTNIDVYKQSAMHLEFLDTRISPAHIGPLDIKSPAYQMVLVDGDETSCTDERSDQDKKILPYVRLEHLHEWMCDTFQTVIRKRIQWDVKALHKRVTQLKADSDKTFSQHVSKKEGK